MPKIKCPIPSCEYETPDVDAVIVAALITTHSSTHSVTQAARVEKISRPTISSTGTSEEWAYFKTRWEDYAQGTRIGGREYVVQLLECCDEVLRRDLTRTHGSLTEKTKEEVMAAIRALAVREENQMVARVTLNDMRQDRDEPIRAYAARLRGQAEICGFTTKCAGCNNDVSYRDAVLRDTLVRGLADEDIQLSLMSDTTGEKSLEETMKFVEVKESGKRSVLHLSGVRNVDAASSSYRKKERQAHQGKASLAGSCSYCGKEGHDVKAPPKVRRKCCTAYDHTCTKCGRLHHFESVCRSKPEANTSDSQGAIFSAASTSVTRNRPKRKDLHLEHHVHNALTDTWVKRASQRQPFININVSTSAEEYRALGHSLPVSPRNITVAGMADTGCQSCLAGTHFMRRLGFSRETLIPVTMTMHAANSNGISILGGIIATFSAKAVDGELKTSKQIIYISEDCDKLFISREACTALGTISENFPIIGEASHPSAQPGHAHATYGVSETGTNDTGLTAPCDCPSRRLPPTPPSKLPLPATDGNRKGLQEFLLQHYASSTFNTCPHQPQHKHF